MTTLEERLTERARPACKTCTFIEALPPEQQAEWDEAMKKPRWSDQLLASEARATSATLTHAVPPGDSSIELHRQRGHRADEERRGRQDDGR